MYNLAECFVCFTELQHSVSQRHTTQRRICWTYRERAV